MEQKLRHEAKTLLEQGKVETSGFSVFTHQQVPCNDGGISLGQAVIAKFHSGKEE